MSLNMVRIEAYQNPKIDERNKVVLAHLPQIKYIAQRLAAKLPPEVQLEDLINAGVIGLLDAYGKFDASKGVSFKTYASVRIRGAMLDNLRGLDWAPRDLRSQSRKVERAYAELEQGFGRPATDEEVSREMELSLAEFHTLLDRLNGLTIGYFQAGNNTNDRVDADHLPLNYSPISPVDSPYESVQKLQMKELMTRMIKQLPEREQLILSLYYYEELTMKEIGQILGVNESRVSQLHTRAMLRIRAKLQAVLKMKDSKKR